MTKIVFAFGLILLLISGCTSMKSGGAPEAAFSLQSDRDALIARFGTEATITQYYSASNNDPLGARNKFISGRLALIDLNYLQYVQSLTADKQKLNTATELANMSLGLAGTLVGGVRAKTNLAAAVTGLGGAKTTIDKEYYYEKSLDALIDAMNAKRKAVLVGILKGRATVNVDDYSFEQALTQLNEYYMAGTINGALRFISANAATQEKASDVEIQNIPRLTKSTKEIVASKKTLFDAVRPASEAAAVKALQNLHADMKKFPAPSDAKRGLYEIIDDVSNDGLTIAEKNAKLKEIQDAFLKAGMLQ